MKEVAFCLFQLITSYDLHELYVLFEPNFNQYVMKRTLTGSIHLFVSEFQLCEQKVISKGESQ